MPRAKRPQMTVRELRDILDGICRQGVVKSCKPVFLFSDQEGNEINGVHQVQIAPDGIFLVPRHWTEG